MSKRPKAKSEAHEVKLVLASSSPRRAQLLRNAAIPFTVCGVNITETRRPQEWPEDYVRRVAEEKAKAARTRYAEKFVLGADTVVIVDGQMLGKPADAKDASRMLHLLSAGSHLVTTGVCLLGPNVEDTRAETTTVSFGPLTDEDIAEYVATGEPMDKAGAYAIQGIASRWVTHLEGCYFNVMGLPVPLVYRMLQKHGVM